MPVAVVLVVLGLCSVGAFKERLPLPRPDPPALFATAERIGAGVRAALPTLESSLTRVRLDVEVPGFHANTAFAARLSSLDGYAIPTRRFSELVYALRGHRFDPTGNIFQLPADDPAFDVLHQLYNVTDRVTLASSPDHPIVTPLGPTAGPAWFSASVTRVEDLAALVRELRRPGATLYTRVREVSWHVATDLPATPEIAPDTRCRDAAVTKVEAPRHGGAIVAHVETSARCPLTLATNFTEDLRATAVLADGRRMAVPVSPAYGALAFVKRSSAIRRLLGICWFQSTISTTSLSCSGVSPSPFAASARSMMCSRVCGVRMPDCSKRISSPRQSASSLASSLGA